MNRKTLTYALLTGLAAGAALSTYRAHADTPSDKPVSGTAVVYRGIAPDQIEQLSTPQRINSVAQKPSAPSAIWQALEHGEKVDCLDCIPVVETLLYDSNAKNREISAWWLRRRIFGVFGPGEVYERVVATLTASDKPELRARAAEALGEFLDGAGVEPVAKALKEDSSPVVRAAAARALDRLNSPGPSGELSLALADSDPTVRLNALTAAIHVHGFSDVAAVARLASDTSEIVRRHAAAALGAMRATDSVAALMALTSAKQESDPRTRAEAAHSLGLIGDPAAKSALVEAQSDADQFVRDAATMALRRM
jgi:HEAT repeat protein